MTQTLTATPDPQVDTVTVARAAGDPLRANILRVLAYDSYGVLELGEIFEMAQPAISHHLKTLHNAGLVTRRKEGTHVFYQRTAAGSRPLLTALFEELDESPLPTSLSRRIDHAHQARLVRSREFFATHAEALAQQRALICAPSVYLDTVTDIAAQQPPLARRRVLEVGTGDGTLLRSLADLYKEATGIDVASEMVDTTRMNLVDLENCHLLEGDFLSIAPDRPYNLIVAAMVVHHMASPGRFFAHAWRHLHKDGLLIVVELNAHTQEWVKELCGDVWLGFSPDRMINWAERQKFTLVHQQFLAQRNGFPVHVHAFQPKQLLEESKQ